MPPPWPVASASEPPPTPSAPLQIKPHAPPAALAAGAACSHQPVRAVPNCWPKSLLIKDCSRPCNQVCDEASVTEAAEPASPNSDSQPEVAVAAAPAGAARSPNALGSIPNAVSRLDMESKNAVGSMPNKASKLVTELSTELMIGSMITSSPSACAGGTLANGVNPNAKNAPAEPPRPSVARRRAFPFTRRFFFECCPDISPNLSKCELSILR